MAYAEKHGRGWRARWPDPDGRLRSASGFSSRKAAEDYGRDRELGRRLYSFTREQLIGALTRLEAYPATAGPGQRVPINAESMADALIEALEADEITAKLDANPAYQSALRDAESESWDGPGIGAAEIIAAAGERRRAAAREEFLAASMAVWREIDRLDAEPERYHPVRMSVELRKRERAAWERYRDLLS